MGEFGKHVEILFVEDNPADVRLMLETLKEDKVLNRVSVAKDGLEAMAFLRQDGKYTGAPRPGLILLDLNLPGKDGREVLAEIKADENLRRIPVVILTVSEAEEDILKSYDLHANCYITKPVGLDDFIKVVKSIGHFWFTIVKLRHSIESPSNETTGRAVWKHDRLRLDPLFAILYNTIRQVLCDRFCALTCKTCLHLRINYSEDLWHNRARTVESANNLQVEAPFAPLPEEG